MAEGVFENNWFLNVPRENAPRLIHLFLNVPCGTITLKQGRLGQILAENPMNYKKQVIENNILFRSEPSSEASGEPRDRYIFSI